MMVGHDASILLTVGIREMVGKHMAITKSVHCFLSF